MELVALLFFSSAANSDPVLLKLVSAYRPQNASRLNVQLKNKATLSEQSNLTTAEPQRRIALGGLTNQLQPKNVINAKPL